MTTDGFVARSAKYWSRRAWERKGSMDHPATTIGPASDVRRIDPATGEVIADIKSDEEPRARTGRTRTRRK